MPQTAQYPNEMPKTKATMMVKSKRNESRNGVISLSFYRPKTAVVNRSHDGNGALGGPPQNSATWLEATLPRVDAVRCCQIRYGSRATSSLFWIDLGFVKLSGNSLYVPAVVVGVVYIPYVAKPVRAQVLTLREREFVDAARQQGLSHTRIMMSEILPNLSSTIVVFVPLILANAILLEAGLSFLGAGVQPPNPSWGTLISDGVHLIPAAIHLTIVPGVMLVLCVLGINVFGDGLRDALDPRAQVKVRFAKVRRSVAPQAPAPEHVDPEHAEHE